MILPPAIPEGKLCREVSVQISWLQCMGHSECTKVKWRICSLGIMGTGPFLCLEEDQEKGIPTPRESLRYADAGRFFLFFLKKVVHYRDCGGVQPRCQAVSVSSSLRVLLHLLSVHACLWCCTRFYSLD